MEPIKLSVNKIIDLVLRCGDIDNRFYDAAPMYLGAALHRKIQKGMGDNYEKEVSLKLETEIDGIPVLVRGRADGIITEPDGAITIDEIKTTTLPLDYIYQQHRQHLGQGKCYAYMYLQTLETPPENISVQLTYFQMESEETRRHTWEFTAFEITDFFVDLLEQYGVWLRFERDWKITRDQSIATLTFPFPIYRKGQRELAVAAYRTISAGKKLYACAPTGIGKTLSSLFPSIKAMGEGKTAPLFYLTAKTVTRTVAEEAVRLMAGGGLRFKAITLRAKDKICTGSDCICNPDYCANAKGHYDRVNAAVLDVIENNDLITPAETEFYARKHQVCPHEMGLDVALWCDLIVGDYNHVFHPEAYLRRFFHNEERDYIFLIDEAHNLTDRVRDMYSAVMRKSDLSQVRTALKDKDAVSKKLRKSLRLLNTYLSDVRKEHEGKRNFVTKEVDMVFIAFVKMAAEAAGEWLAAKNNHELHPMIIDMYFGINQFLMVAEIFDEHYTNILEFYGRDVTVTLFCLNPSKIIADGLSRAKASILFSATLLPLPYYREILGGTEEDYMVTLPSPFDPAKLRLLSHCGISTKYKDRESSYEPIVQTIYRTVAGKTGNYLVFFPSYEYMHIVYDLFCARYPGVETLLQTTEMSEDERAGFLARFDSENPDTLLGFTVLGGIFSEGIDLKGDRLIGTIIVGVGIPKISLRSDLIRDYFNERNGKGYDYAYVFPGMNKVLQAAGRVIRTETDEGTVMLIDSRYATAEYKRLFPAHWAHIQTVWK
ncbi:MAG: ATP-dependent DNA helicase [Firmicutes bacterium]|nr:ATP-dependent DNA helicase [Bacillota bacterium]